MSPVTQHRHHLIHIELPSVTGDTNHPSFYGVNWMLWKTFMDSYLKDCTCVQCLLWFPAFIYTSMSLNVVLQLQPTSYGLANIFMQIHIQTRHISMKSMGNMLPLPPRHLLPHVLLIMPRNPKYDQFQSKRHHNEENPQSLTQLVLKVITIHQHKKFQAISSMGPLANAQKPQIWPLSLSQNSAIISKITRL